VPFESLFQPLAFARGAPMKNRFMMAPLTNKQSHPDGRLSDEEIRWLAMRGEGGFGLVMTAAAHVQREGQGFPGQLGAFSDDHLPGLERVASRLRASGARSAVQLHHAGARADKGLVAQPVAPSEDAESGARALALDEVERLRDDFVAAAVRAEKAGFDGVEIHGAHGYVVTQFLSAETNRRDDRYGGELANRNRLLFEIIEGVRSSTGRDFQLGLRLSPERFGVRLAEIRETATQLFREARIDYLDLSLWDAFKEPAEEEFQGRSLVSYFTELERGEVRLGGAGRITTPSDAAAALDAGLDFVVLGRASILHHDYPARLGRDPGFAPAAVPVSAEHLAAEGVSPVFVDYLRGFRGLVTEDAKAAE
jgi:2,4-dienoyl-CoA reductase-like NADH-dependent reductase (Old Yellow Enzyme family)